MRMLRRTDDDGLQAAAEMVLSKVTVALPDALREHLIEPPFFVSHPQTLIGPLSISPFDLVRGLSEALEQPTAESLKSKYFQNQVMRMLNAEEPADRSRFGHAQALFVMRV